MKPRRKPGLSIPAMFATLREDSSCDARHLRLINGGVAQVRQRLQHLEHELTQNNFSNGNVTSSAKLAELGLTECGRIQYRTEDDLIIVECDHLDQLKNRSGTVYAWAISHVDSANLLISYVGVTKSDVYYRSNVWKGALNRGRTARRKLNSGHVDVTMPQGTGMKIRSRIIKALSEGGEISIWARVADRTRIFGSWYSLAKIEEDALIKMLEPTWNGYKDDIEGE